MNPGEFDKEDYTDEYCSAGVDVNICILRV